MKDDISIDAEELGAFASSIFQAAGSQSEEARVVAEHLVGPICAAMIPTASSASPNILTGSTPETCCRTGMPKSCRNALRS
jgi:hypothetical protein